MTSYDVMADYVEHTVVPHAETIDARLAADFRDHAEHMRALGAATRAAMTPLRRMALARAFDLPYGMLLARRGGPWKPAHARRYRRRR